MLVLTKLVDSLEDHQGDVSYFALSRECFCFYKSFSRKHIGTASSLAASRNAHERMVERPIGSIFPRAKFTKLSNKPNGKAVFCLLIGRSTV